jgi:hypothetical protein
MGGGAIAMPLSIIISLAIIHTQYTKRHHSEWLYYLSLPGTSRRTCSSSRRLARAPRPRQVRAFWLPFLESFYIVNET